MDYRSRGFDKPMDWGNPWEVPNDPCEDGHDFDTIDDYGDGEELRCLREDCEAKARVVKRVSRTGEKLNLLTYLVELVNPTRR